MCRPWLHRTSTTEYYSLVCLCTQHSGFSLVPFLRHHFEHGHCTTTTEHNECNKRLSKWLQNNEKKIENMCMQRKPHHPAHTHTDTDHVQQKVNAYIKHFKLSWNNDHHHCHHFIILEMADSVKLSLSQHPFFFVFPK